MARGRIWKRGAGWAYRVDLPRGPDGKRRQAYKAGYPTRKAAEEALRNVINRSATHFYSGDNITVGEYAPRWLAAIAATVEPKTLEGYETQLRLRIVKHLGHRRVKDLTPLEITEFYTQFASKPRTARYVHQTMSRMFTDALSWGIVASNPIHLVTAPAYRAPEKSMWRAEHVAEFLEQVAERRDAPLWWFLATTGLRRSEALAVRWADIDLDEGTVRVARSQKSSEAGETKTGNRRTIAIPKHMTKLLKAWRKRVRAEALSNGWPLRPETPVWVWETGEPIKPDWLTKTFPKLIPDSLPAVTLHGFRHVHVTLGARAGIAADVMQERVGHRDVRVTLQTYSHVSDLDDRTAAEAIARAILKASS